MSSKGRHLKSNHNFRVSRRVPETSKRQWACAIYTSVHTATPQLRNGRQTAIQSGIRKLSGLGRKLLLINGSKGMGQRPGEECCSNGQSRCCQRHCRNQAGPGPWVSRSRVASSGGRASQAGTVGLGLQPCCRTPWRQIGGGCLSSTGLNACFDPTRHRFWKARSSCCC